MVSFLYRRSHPRIFEVGQHPDGTLRDWMRFDLLPLAPDVLAVRMDSALNFLTAAILEQFITDRCGTNPQLRRVILCANGVNDSDATGTETLESLHRNLKAAGIDFYASAVKKQVWDVLYRARLIAAMGVDHLFATDAHAIPALQAGIFNEARSSHLQS